MFEPRDTLIKTLSMVFLNPTDEDATGKKIFIQRFLGCGCPDEVVAQANIRFLSRPLGLFLESGVAQAPRSQTVTQFEKNVNPLLKLPKTLKWPRSAAGKVVPPSRWRRSAIDDVTKNDKQRETLTHLRALSNTMVDAVIEVPGRAFFFLVVEGRAKLKKKTLRLQYESGQLLFQLMGYNRCRLFTIAREGDPKRIPEIDTALTWSGFYDIFDASKNQYAFAPTILSFFESLKPGGIAWKNTTNFPSGMC